MKPAPKDTAYSGTPLPKKLGLITAKGSIGEIAVLNAPANFLVLLDLSAATHKSLRPTTRLALAFVRSRAELFALFAGLHTELPPEAHIWLIHPKAHIKPDFNQNDLRNAALDIGLVDYKVCSVDADWSGLKFAWRGQSKSPGHRMMKRQDH